MLSHSLSVRFPIADIASRLRARTTNLPPRLSEIHIARSAQEKFVFTACARNDIDPAGNIPARCSSAWQDTFRAKDLADFQARLKLVLHQEVRDGTFRKLKR